MDEVAYLREIMVLRAEISTLKVKMAKLETLNDNYANYIERKLAEDKEFLAYGAAKSDG